MTRCAFKRRWDKCTPNVGRFNEERIEFSSPVYDYLIYIARRFVIAFIAYFALQLRPSTVSIKTKYLPAIRSLANLRTRNPRRFSADVSNADGSENILNCRYIRRHRFARVHTKNLTGFYFRRTRRYRENGEPRERVNQTTG